MRVLPPRRKALLCTIVLAVLTACTIANRRLAPAASVTPTDPHKPWRVLHKGGADLSTGVYVREDDDLVVNTPLPIVLRRTYNSGDRWPRQFGMDATHPGEWWIHGNSDPRVPWGDLILADGGRIHFTRISPGDTDPYVATAEYVVENGSIVQSRLDEGDGLEIRRYNSQHYITSETLYADSVRPIMFAYDLDPRSNVQTGAVMTCAGVAGPVRRTVQVAERLDDMTKQNLMRESCLPPR